jgi:hypothetical protein
MSLAQKAVQLGAVNPARSGRLTLRFAAGIAVRPLKFAGRLFAGHGGPRAYRRQGFPEHEWMQVMSGKRDRFDGL